MYEESSKTFLPITFVYHNTTWLMHLHQQLWWIIKQKAMIRILVRDNLLVRTKFDHNLRTCGRNVVIIVKNTWKKFDRRLWSNLRKIDHNLQSNGRGDCVNNLYTQEYINTVRSKPMCLLFTISILVWREAYASGAPNIARGHAPVLGKFPVHKKLNF